VSSCNPEVLLRAFKVYVRLLLEYTTCIWSPHYNYVIDEIEAMQRKFTTRLKGCKDMEYPTHAQLPSPAQPREMRCLTADLTLTFSIIFGLVDVYTTDYFLLKSASGDCIITHSNPFKLLVNYCRTNKRKNCFSEHVVKVWNSLLPSIVNFSSLPTFRNSVSKIIFRTYTKY